MVNITKQTDGQKLIPDSMFFPTNKQKASHYSILLMECHPVPSDPSIRKMCFCIHPCYLAICSLLMHTNLPYPPPKNRLITVKQLHCILIAFMTMILSHYSERILIRSRLLIGHHTYFHFS